MATFLHPHSHGRCSHSEFCKEKFMTAPLPPSFCTPKCRKFPEHMQCHPEAKFVWIFILVSKGIYVAYICNFCNLDEFLSFQRRSTRLLQVLSWGRCYSLTLSSAELIISSQCGLVQLSRSYFRVAVHGPERLSGITGVCGVSIQSSALSLTA